MKTSIIAAAAIAGVATATKGSSGYGGYDSKANDCPFVPSPDQYILFADNIQTISRVDKDKSFLRSQDLYVETPGDLGTASSFTVPDFATGANCSINLAVPTSDQVLGDLSQVTFSGYGNFNFTRLLNNLPSSGLTANTLGTEVPTGSQKVIPGELLTLASFPCPPPGTQLPGIIDSIDTVLILKDALGPVCLSGLFVIIEPVGNPPASPPRPAAPPAPAATTSTGGGDHTYSTYSTAATYSSVWHS
ncbi:hypothetical protein G647_01959 [Cladophialophora carrionii CBS 160.54]|uniref:Ubiquitin 3 binding protein But2 C-terminal domain-containing protein n=1 Tax=Cladophialophora carrionii CBS 160.54 TaxID=1279043 RepID=V9DS82_9EURO|nr:uncharacterized protein G647_01959 [Cladophialophora carrionii CBS 160.54]ETI29506.1 hypothetical protein G647_01959 [Cladophialophora carrionii CBS 160.54]